METGRTIALIKALGGGSGSGGGSEEQFVKVYEDTLSSASSVIQITSTDMEGSYIDVIVGLNNSSPLTNSLDFEIIFTADAEGDEEIYRVSPSVGSGANWNAFVYIVSNSGLLTWNQQIWDLSYTSESGFAEPYFLMYPTNEKQGVETIWIGTDSEIPAGTTITVYARKKVS